MPSTPRHRLRRRRPDTATVLAALSCLLLATAIATAFLNADIPVTDCYLNPDVHGRWC